MYVCMFTYEMLFLYVQKKDLEIRGQINCQDLPLGTPGLALVYKGNPRIFKGGSRTPFFLYAQVVGPPLEIFL